MARSTVGVWERDRGSLNIARLLDLELVVSDNALSDKDLVRYDNYNEYKYMNSYPGRWLLEVPVYCVIILIHKSLSFSLPASNTYSP